MWRGRQQHCGFVHSVASLITFLPHHVRIRQPIKKFPAYYGIRKFIAVFTRARHLPLSWGWAIQSMPYLSSWRSPHLRLGLQSGLFLSLFPTKTLYAYLLSPKCATSPAHLILLGLITQIIAVRVPITVGQRQSARYNIRPILIRSNKMQQYAGIYLLQNHSTNFGCPSHPSSGVHKTVTAVSGAGHSIWATTFLQRGL